MKNIKFLVNKNKIDKKILSDLKKFENIHRRNKIAVLPDVHQKKRRNVTHWLCIVI